MIKILNIKFECRNCGAIINLKREIVIDEFTKKIDIIYPRCSCGNKARNKFNLLDLELNNYKGK